MTDVIDVFQPFGFLFAYPGFGIELDCFLAELEVKGAVAAAIVGNGAEKVACLDLLSLRDDGAGKVAINGDVAAVTDKDIASAGILEDAGDGSVEDGTRTGTRSADIVRPFIVELHILHARHVVESEAAAQHILAGDGHRQASLVLLECAVDVSVFSCEPGAGLSGCSGASGCSRFSGLV